MSINSIIKTRIKSKKIEYKRWKEYVNKSWKKLVFDLIKLHNAEWTNNNTVDVKLEDTKSGQALNIFIGKCGVITVEWTRDKSIILYSNQEKEYITENYKDFEDSILKALDQQL